MRDAWLWVQRTKGSIGAIIFALGLVISAAAMAKVPAKLDAHVAQTARQLDEANHQLRVLVCLQARLRSVGQCLAETQ